MLKDERDSFIHQYQEEKEEDSVVHRRLISSETAEMGLYNLEIRNMALMTPFDIDFSRFHSSILFQTFAMIIARICSLLTTIVCKMKQELRILETLSL